MNMKLLVLSAIGFVCAQGKTLWHQLDDYTFTEFVEEYNKDYAADSEEWAVREAIFNTKLHAIREHNKDTTKTWKNGVNKFTDMTSEEMNSYKGYNRQMAHAYRATAVTQAPKTVGALPTAVDWREKGLITPVKNQGGCGSCWAFAATETLESHWMAATGTLPLLAPQELVDCTPNPDHCGGTGGCQGATAQLAYDYLKQPKGPGQTLEKNYPYRGSTGKCQTGNPAAANVTSHTDLPSNDMDALMTAVATIGPISISMDASWGAYESGVFQGCSKDATIDHAIQLVGYGEDGADKYWLVRNSWGASWGEEGYIRIKRYDSSTDYCGTDHNPADGSGCTGGPATVKVCGQCGILYDTTYPVVAK